MYEDVGIHTKLPIFEISDYATNVTVQVTIHNIHSIDEIAMVSLLFCYLILHNSLALLPSKCCYNITVFDSLVGQLSK